MTARDITDAKKSREALQESEERFRSLIENASDAVAIVDINGTIIYESPSVEKVLGYVSEEIVGTNGFDLIHPDDKEGILEKFVEVVNDPDKKKLITVINPEIKEMKRKEIDMEGCLSFPEIFLSIERAKKVVLTGFDEKEKTVYFEVTGLIARCFQHEIDHLNGVLIIDYATEEEKKFWQAKLNKIKKTKIKRFISDCAS